MVVVVLLWRGVACVFVCVCVLARLFVLAVFVVLPIRSGRRVLSIHGPAMLSKRCGGGGCFCGLGLPLLRRFCVCVCACEW